MTEHPRSIAVSGSGTAEAAPDLLTLSIGVECRRAGVEAAYGDAARASSAVTEVLRGHGVANADITTSGLNLRAEVSWQEGRGQLVSGYLASSMLRVRLRDLAASSGLIAAAVAAWSWAGRTPPRSRPRPGRRRGTMPAARPSTSPHWPAPGWARPSRSPGGRDPPRRSRWPACNAPWRPSR